MKKVYKYTVSQFTPKNEYVEIYSRVISSNMDTEKLVEQIMDINDISFGNHTDKLKTFNDDFSTYVRTKTKIDNESFREELKELREMEKSFLNARRKLKSKVLDFARNKVEFSPILQKSIEICLHNQDSLIMHGRVNVKDITCFDDKEMKDVQSKI